MTSTVEKYILPADVWPDTDRSYVAVIDLIDACNLRCPECIRGSRTMKNSPGKMDISLFKDICSKLLSEKITNICLHNWTEPFLNPKLAEFINVASSMNFITSISSNISLPDIPVMEAFDAGLSNLVVSISGHSNEIQNIYHRGSDIRIVHDNLKKIAKKKIYAEKTALKFLEFNYNRNEAIHVKKLAERLQMMFTPTQASGDPEKCMGEQKFSVTMKEKVSIIHDDKTKKQYINYDPKHTCAQKGYICNISINPTIDYKGRLYLCCDRPNFDIFYLGDYLDMSVPEMLLKKYLHPECKNCTRKPILALTDEQKETMSALLF